MLLFLLFFVTVMAYISDAKNTLQILVHWSLYFMEEITEKH